MILLKPSSSPNASSASSQSYRWSLFSGILLFSLFSGTDALAYSVDAESHERVNSHVDARYQDMGLKYTNSNGEPLVEIALDTQVTMTVSGMLNRVVVRQTFRNPTSDWLDGEYRFPLPTDAAVDGLTMKVGDRLVQGVIQPKEKAKRIFIKAKKQGRKASLLEQDRPNIFTTLVANLAPNERLIVEISYQELVNYDAGHFSIRYPMTITPRYFPRLPNMSQQYLEDANKLSFNGWLSPRALASTLNSQKTLQDNQEKSHPANTLLPKRSPQTADMNGINVSLEVLLNPGFPLDTVASPYHKVLTEQVGGQRLKVSLQPDYVADKDFVLSWHGDNLSLPNAALFTQIGLTHKSQSLTPQKNQQAYGLLMFMPPELKLDQNTNADNSGNITRIPRELTLVIDTSGSMSGQSMEQAKAAVIEVLDTLIPCQQSIQNRSSQCDSFNLLAFNHQTRRLFSSPKPATKHYLDQARRFVAALEAEGGTEMMTALTEALPVDSNDADKRPTEHSLKQVIFITDGAVGNEKALFNTIAERLGEHRLFTVGIGSAPNSHFMHRAAELGRGSFTYIGKVTEVKQKMAALSAKIAKPALTDIVVTYSDGTVPDYWPANIPDLYQGEPLILALKLQADESRELWLSGSIAGQAWHKKLSTQSMKTQSIADNPEGLDLVWARKKIAHLELNKRPMTALKTKQQVTGLSMKYHLMSPYTSLVAVDMSEQVEHLRPNGVDTLKGQVRQHQPKGSQQPASLPQTASWSQFYLFSGLGLMLTSLLLLWFSISLPKRKLSLY